MRQRSPFYTSEAIADLRRLQFFIGLDDKRFAKHYVAELRAYIRNAAAKGLTGSAREEFGSDLRYLTYDRQLIIFAVSDIHLILIHIRDGAQNLPHILQGP
jgi:plasmid stabilization system protein ParE